MCSAVSCRPRWPALPRWRRRASARRRRATVFVSTLIIDDPAVSDEASLPTLSWQQQPGSPVTGAYNVNFELDKRITDRFGFAVNDGYSVMRSAGLPNQGGWQNLAVTLKYQPYVNAEHYQFVDQELKATTVPDPDTGIPAVVFNNGAKNRWVGGVSIRSSIPICNRRCGTLGRRLSSDA